LHLIYERDHLFSQSRRGTAAYRHALPHGGISIFADYRYYPNQVVYHKIMDALEKQGTAKE
jgi:hypothetical protein